MSNKKMAWFSIALGGVGVLITAVAMSSGLYDTLSIIGGIGCLAILVYGLYLSNK